MVLAAPACRPGSKAIMLRCWRWQRQACCLLQAALACRQPHCHPAVAFPGPTGAYLSRCGAHPAAHTSASPLRGRLRNECHVPARSTDRREAQAPHCLGTLPQPMHDASIVQCHSQRYRGTIESWPGKQEGCQSAGAWTRALRHPACRQSTRSTTSYVVIGSGGAKEQQGLSLCCAREDSVATCAHLVRASLPLNRSPIPP